MSRMTHKFALAGALALALLGIAGTASAATVSYTNHASINVPNNSGIAGIPDTVTVPAGRTPVQSVEVSNAQPIWSSGGTDFEMWLTDPSNTRLDLMTIGCPTMNPGTHFAVRDGAAVFADDTIAFCNNQLNGGEGKPNDPSGGTFASSKYNGKPIVGHLDAVPEGRGHQRERGRVQRLDPADHPCALHVLTASANKQKLKKMLLDQRLLQRELLAVDRRGCGAGQLQPAAEPVPAAGRAADQEGAQAARQEGQGDDRAHCRRRLRRPAGHRRRSRSS